jgi:hypothetical protein
MSASSHLELLSGRPLIGSSPLDLASVLSKATPGACRAPAWRALATLDGEAVVTGEDGIGSARPIGPGRLGTGSRSRTPTARRWCAAIRLVQTADGRTSPFVERGSEFPPNPGAAKVLTRIRSPAPPGPPLSGGSDGGITYGYSIDAKLRSEPSGDQECTRVRSAR